MSLFLFTIETRHDKNDALIFRTTREIEAVDVVEANKLVVKSLDSGHPSLYQTAIFERQLA